MKKITLALVSLLLVVCLCGCNMTDYKAAAAKMQAGEYEEAAEAFEALGDYKDSAAMAQKCRYEWGAQQEGDGNFEKAAGIFEGLGDYMDAADMAEMCWYEAGEEQESSGDYKAAAGYFLKAGSYKDAKSLAALYERIFEPEEFIAAMEAALSGGDLTYVFEKVSIDDDGTDISYSITVSDYSVGVITFRHKDSSGDLSTSGYLNDAILMIMLNDAIESGSEDGLTVMLYLYDILSCAMVSVCEPENTYTDLTSDMASRIGSVTIGENQEFEMNGNYKYSYGIYTGDNSYCAFDCEALGN